MDTLGIGSQLLTLFFQFFDSVILYNFLINHINGIDMF